MPIRFERLDNGGFIVANFLGDTDFLSEAELNRLVDLELDPGDGLYERAFARQFIWCCQTNGNSSPVGRSYPKPNSPLGGD